ncbi:MAG: UDP-N-acetylglucosamine 1-carboxyvinyltransferase [Patescibacteria group bacterium]
MSKIKIVGRKELSGEIKVSGAKNAALKILPAAILADSASTIHNVPDILDVRRMEDILRSVGVKIWVDGDTVTLDPRQINNNQPEARLMRKLRGSIVLVGPLLARFGEVNFSQPGGCLIGARPIDDHLDLFAQMGVEIRRHGRNYHLKGKPRAADITLNKMSVTATENAIMAAVLSSGTTRIHVAAAEPEIADLARFLNRMGAKVRGAGTHDITIEGVSNLKGADHIVVPDRIEAGTFLMAALATNSKLIVGPIVPEHLSIVLKKLRDTGADIDILARQGQRYLEVKKHAKLKPVSIDTRTYPGFPTDLQSPYAALMTQANGPSRIFETIFEGRFSYLSEMAKMGAKHEVLSPHIIQIFGPTPLRGKRLTCSDLRGGAALVIAGLIANGETVIDQCEFIDRGYENIDGKLSQAGAEIFRIK